MGKQSIFEYLNLEKQTLQSRAGNPYTRYVVVSDQNMETKKVAGKLGPLGFKWNGKEWWVFGNKLTKIAVDKLKEINVELQTQGGQSGDLDNFLSQLEAFKAEVQGADIPLRTKTELESNLEQYIEDIANATDERAATAELQKFLNFSSRFHQYSFNNIMFIYLQNPNATKVAGRNKWKKDFNRTIVDLNKAITINCGNKFYRHPRTGKLAEYTLDQQKADREYVRKVQSGIASMDRNKMDAISTRKDIKHIGFKPCVVFDIADTTGDPIPDEPLWKGSNDERADAIALFSIAKKSLESMGIRVTQDPATAGEGGWSRKGQINVSADASGSGAASTIFHEWSHDMLHQKGGRFYEKAQKYFEAKGELNYTQIKQIKEVQAETVSATLCKHFGLPADHHPTYMALWQAQGGLNSKQLIKENISTISTVCNFILKQVDKYDNEFQVAKASMNQQQPNTINESKKKSKYKKAKDSLIKSKSINKDMKDLILKYMLGGSTYHEGGHIHGLSKPQELRKKSIKINAVSMGADKNGFYVYTHRARSKSHSTPDKISVKEIEFIESTG